ncbi:cytochrome-c peroxidase [Nautilia sp.]
MRIIGFAFLILIFANAQELIEPIPQNIKYDRQKAELGKMLFFDTSFSKDGRVSCASCHSSDEGWADRRKVSKGVYGKKGDVQSPTVLNAVFNFRQFWNGRAKDLKEQIEGPINNPNEMGFNVEKVTKIINFSPKYKKMFEKVYGKKKYTFDDFADAIAEFEKALITPECKFDLYLRGKAPLSGEEEKGYILFKKYGCVTCHNGINIGGNSFQKIGVIFPVKDCRDDRFQITHNPIDKCVYKVPTLRNIALTAPYFHSGITYELYEAVQIMAYHNLGFKLPKKDAKSIVAFLKTLTGKKPAIMKEKNDKKSER